MIDKDKLARLAEQARNLMEPTELLNEKLKAAQSAIARLKLGVTASVTDKGVILIWIKSDNDWGLVACRELLGHPTPLLHCSREIRAIAAGMLPALLCALGKKLDEDTDAVHAAIESVDGFLAEFRETT